MIQAPPRFLFCGWDAGSFGVPVHWQVCGWGAAFDAGGGWVYDMETGGGKIRIYPALSGSISGGNFQYLRIHFKKYDILTGFTGFTGY